MSDQTRNQKGRWIDEGKESATIRLDKDVVDLGREEIQNRIRMPKIYFKCTKCGEVSWIMADFSKDKPMIAEDTICDNCLEEEN